MTKWKCIHKLTTSAKKCLDLGHRDCLKNMCEKNDITDIEKIEINFTKNDIGDRKCSISVSILAYLCELQDLDSIKYLLDEKKYDPHCGGKPLRGYEYLLASVCYSKNYDIFLYIYNKALLDNKKLINLVYPCIYGNLDMVKHIYNNLTDEEKNNKIVYSAGIFHAIHNNHIDVIRFVVDKFNIDLKKECEIMGENFAQFVSLEMWKYLMEEKNITNVTSEMLKYAKKYNKDKNVYPYLCKMSK